MDKLLRSHVVSDSVGAILILLFEIGVCCSGGGIANAFRQRKGNIQEFVLEKLGE